MPTTWERFAIVVTSIASAFAVGGWSAALLGLSIEAAGFLVWKLAVWLVSRRKVSTP